MTRSLFAPTSLARALRRLGFVQADPIRAPARAQDLTLRHRVRGYSAGDLERRYPKLDVEEDFVVNYGFVTQNVYELLHPRTPARAWTAKRRAQAEAMREFVAQRGVVHPREADAHFSHGRVRNWFGGTSNASTQLLDDMHYRGMLRVARRESGIRLYALPRARLLAEASGRAVPAPPGHVSEADRLDALIDLLIAKYAPVPAPGLSRLMGLLRGGAPQVARLRGAALGRAQKRHPTALVDGVQWIWPAGENPSSARWQADGTADDSARLLAPFDPVVWDRWRFERFWGWAYRFEAYTPASKRKLGYYALPLLWGTRVVGWANLALSDGRLTSQVGFVDRVWAGDRRLSRAIEAELARVAAFLGAER